MNNDKYRELKFRAWDPINKCFPMSDFSIVGECTVFDLVTQYEIKHALELKIQQYTGFRDINNTPIYEGDIVAWPTFPNNSPQEVIFNTEEGLWGLYNSKNPLTKSYKNVPLSQYGAVNSESNKIHGFWGAIQIIGNIFQTPELLDLKYVPMHYFTKKNE